MDCGTGKEAWHGLQCALPCVRVDTHRDMAVSNGIMFHRTTLTAKDMTQHGEGHDAGHDEAVHETLEYLHPLTPADADRRSVELWCDQMRDIHPKRVAGPMLSLEPTICKQTIRRRYTFGLCF